MNHITVVGRVGRDPELRFTGNGMAIVNFSVATDYGRDDKKKTTWHNVVAFDKMAENIAESLHKGARVIVAGRLDVSEYDDKNGDKKKRTELIADAVGLELRFEPVKSVFVAEDPEESF
jgi:single-strand DNA-binding protein